MNLTLQIMIYNYCANYMNETINILQTICKHVVDMNRHTAIYCNYEGG